MQNGIIYKINAIYIYIIDTSGQHWPMSHIHIKCNAFSISFIFSILVTSIIYHLRGCCFLIALKLKCLHYLCHYCVLRVCTCMLSSSFFSLILDCSVGLWVGIQSAGELVSETSQLRILHSAEEDDFSPFDSKIACLCQSIEINNNKHVCWHTSALSPSWKLLSN